MTTLMPGDPAPWFVAAASNNPQFSFSTVAGRYIVLCFFGSAALPIAEQVLADVAANRHRFSDDHAAFFGVSVDRADQSRPNVRALATSVRFFWDFDGNVSRLYGAMDPIDRSSTQYRPFSIVLDPMLRVLRVYPMSSQEGHVAELLRYVDSLPPIGDLTPAAPQAPVLVLPRVFEPAFCRHLISLYQQHGGEDSGFMRERDGKTVRVLDHNHKRRSDYVIEDENVRKACQARILRRLVPEIKKAFQFEVTRMERYIVACYEAETRGHFRPHRDNTTKGTAHRRFAVTLNLNAEEFEGGELRFPEFGPHTYKAPTGGAVVFSCSLLHEAMPVTKGTRYVFLPFVYDEAAAAIREANNKYLAEDVGEYRR